MSTFWGQFLPNLVATLVGAFVGFLLALRFDHARESRSRMEQEASLLRAARDAAEHNVQLIAQLKPILFAAPPMPSFEMDTVILDALVPQLVQLSSDTDLLARLNDFRFQLHHINRKLDHLLSHGFTPISVTPLAQGVTLTAGNLEKSGKETLLPSIDARIASLETLQRQLIRPAPRRFPSESSVDITPPSAACPEPAEGSHYRPPRTAARSWC